jgi:hypothetical protein
MRFPTGENHPAAGKGVTLQKGYNVAAGGP